MEKFWKVCEIEEIVQSFTELSVAALPETWIVELEDESYICYWPKKDSSKKVRSFASVEDGGKWSTYKCRILLKGEKFSTYEEVRKAETDAQNVSSTINDTLNGTMDFDVTDDDSSNDDDNESSVHDAFEADVSVRPLSSTMDFKATDNSEKTIGNDVSKLNSTMDFDVSNDLEINGEIIGNDTADFNKAALMGGGYYYSNTPMTVLEQDGSTVSCSSVESGYNRFEQCNDFLCSTALDDEDGLKNIGNEALVSHIKALESVVLSFHRDIKSDLREIKQILSQKSDNTSEDRAIEKLMTIPNSNGNQSIDEVMIVDDLDGGNSQAHNQSKGHLIPIRVLLDSSNAMNEIVLLDESEDIIPVIQKNIAELPSPSPYLLKSTEDLGSNETFVFPEQRSIHEQENFGAPNESIVFPEELKIKVFNKDEFRGNEDLLGLNEEMEKDLVQHLLAQDDEDERSYIKRTVYLLFDEDFFLDFITWKREKDRQNIKGTNLLKCWKESHGKKFRPDPKDLRFMTHFRRIKNTIRAGRKAAAEAKEKKNHEVSA